MKYPVIDLHCDLLGCVEENDDTVDFDHPITNCSVPQQVVGSVATQVLAVAAITKEGSAQKGENQVELYKELLKQYPNSIQWRFAIENASALVNEDEPLEKAIERFDAFAAVEKIVYVSLTWNHENRFGGGNETRVGLKADGKVLLDYLDGKNVAIDLSHTSDRLADDILNYLDRKNLSVQPIASHSNFREITPMARNLPDAIAKEIIARGGVIGINFVRRFVGDDPSGFLRHIEHGLSLGAENALCLGADFYGGLISMLPPTNQPTFFDAFANSSCYPQFFEFLAQEFDSGLIEKIAYLNAKGKVAHMSEPARVSSD